MVKRIQMTRKQPWRHLHPDAVIVARPSKFGNPFDFREAAAVGYGDGRGAAVDAFRGWLNGEDWGIPQGQTRASMAAKRAVIKRSIEELRGRDLACWCPLDAPCHADVLMALANAPAPTCPHCNGTGTISRPYICGLTDPDTGEKYDLNTVTVCGCGEKQETEGET